MAGGGATGASSQSQVRLLENDESDMLYLVLVRHPVVITHFLCLCYIRHVKIYSAQHLLLVSGLRQEFHNGTKVYSHFLQTHLKTCFSGFVDVYIVTVRNPALLSKYEVCVCVLYREQ